MAERDDETIAAREAASSKLYAAPFARFVEVRKALVAELRAGGDRPGAEALAAAKKPTRAAWALNQVAHRHGEELARFVREVEEARTAQATALARKDAGGLRAAARAMNDAVMRVLELAAGAIEEDGAQATEALKDAITATLRAVPLAQEDEVRRLTRGVLVDALGEEEDLGALAGAAAVDVPAKVAEPAGPKPDARAIAEAKRREREERERAAAEAARRAREVARLEKEAADAEREAVRLEGEAEVARKRAGEIEARAKVAREAAEAARAKVAAAREGAER